MRVFVPVETLSYIYWTDSTSNRLTVTPFLSDSTGTCIMIYKECLERNERLTTKRQKKVWHIQSWSFPGTVFRAVCFPVISVDRPTDVQAVRSQLKELPEPFLCWLLPPLHLWVLSTLWPCDVPIQAHSHRATQSFLGTNSSCILWVCLCGRDRVCRCKQMQGHSNGSKTPQGRCRGFYSVINKSG